MCGFFSDFFDLFERYEKFVVLDEFLHFARYFPDRVADKRLSHGIGSCDTQLDGVGARGGTGDYQGARRFRHIRPRSNWQSSYILVEWQMQLSYVA